ncbi:MAG: hypothetical protein HC848_02290, partial [Limnobacter sp.]|nr:hypothetical protein [Limnobacter sp.]
MAYLMAVYCSSIFGGLSFNRSHEPHYSVVVTLLVFVVGFLLIAVLHIWMENHIKSRTVYRLMFGTVILALFFVLHFGFMVFPQRLHIESVNWSGIFLLYLFMLGYMWPLTRFGADTWQKIVKPVEQRITYLLLLTAGNFIIVLGMLANVNFKAVVV